MMDADTNGDHAASDPYKIVVSGDEVAHSIVHADDINGDFRRTKKSFSLRATTMTTSRTTRNMWFVFR
jgi:hypothetical protein